MTRDQIIAAYTGYIDCLNRQNWDNLHQFVAVEAIYNGEVVGLEGYRAMLVDDFKAIPDLFFNVTRIAADPPVIASRIAFDCKPVGELFGLPVNGRRVRFTENVFYEFSEGRIQNVWSVIDKAAIVAQLR